MYGCSFTTGVGLNDDETFAFYIQKYTQRKVYNRALAGYGIQHMLYHSKHNIDLLKQQNDFIEPEFIIYTFIEDHIHRLFKPNDFFDVYLMFYKYNKEKTKLVEISDKDLLYWHSYILRALKYKKYDDNLKYDSTGKFILNDEAKKYMLIHFLEMNNEIKKNFHSRVLTSDLLKSLRSELTIQCQI